MLEGGATRLIARVSPDRWGATRGYNVVLLDERGVSLKDGDGNVRIWSASSVRGILGKVRLARREVDTFVDTFWDVGGAP